MGLAVFLRRRRESLQPEDVGLPRGRRRRTGGCDRRRWPCSATCRPTNRAPERERGPRPSERMSASIAGAPTLARRASPPVPVGRPQPGPTWAESVSTSTPAYYVSSTVCRTCAPRSSPNSARRCAGARWASRSAMPARTAASATGGLPTPPLDTPTRPGHTLLTRMFASNLLDVATLRGPGSRTMHLIDLLLARSEEFRKMWDQHLKRSVVPRFSDCRDAFRRTTGRSA